MYFTENEKLKSDKVQVTKNKKISIWSQQPVKN